MQFFTISAFVVLLLSSVVAAQSPPPPAKPRAVDTITVSSKWESPEGLYKVAFPGKPATTSSTFESAFGPAIMYSSTLGTTFAHYTVSYFDFPTAITNKFDLDTRFAMMRDKMAKSLSGRITLDSEYMFGSHYGHANVIEAESYTLSTRTVLVGPRMYLIQVVTPGRLSSQAEAVASSTQVRVDKFLNSFEVTKVLDAQNVEAPLPATFGVTANETLFRSTFLGVSLTPPAGWALSQQEDSELLFELGKERIRKSNARLADYITSETARVLAMYTNTDVTSTAPEAFLFILAEKIAFPNFRAEAVANNYVSLYREKKLTKPVTITQIGGHEAAWLEVSDPSGNAFQRIYFLNIKGIAFEISASYKKTEHLAALLAALVKAIESLRFD